MGSNLSLILALYVMACLLYQCILQSSLHIGNNVPGYLVLPSIESLTPSTSGILLFHLDDVKPVFYCLFTFTFLLNKDITPAFLKSSVMYQILCGSCSKVYIGSTGKNLEDRITSHLVHLKLNFNNTGVLHMEKDFLKWLQLAKIITL